MGNVLEHESSGGVEDADVIEDDLKWLAVKGSMVFNDDFLEEEYATLPHYDGTEMDPDHEDEQRPGELAARPSDPCLEWPEDGRTNRDAVVRMLQLLGPPGNSNSAATVGVETGLSGRGTSVEDFPILLGERYMRMSTHATAFRMRARLFQRMHLALLRQAYRSMNSPERAKGKRGTGSKALSTLALPPSASVQASEEDPTAIMTSASMRLSLTVMDALRGSCPGLFISMAQTLMDLFGSSAPFSLGKVRSSAYQDTLSQVRRVAEDVATGKDSSHEEKAQAMSLLLSLSIATGSVSGVVGVAKLLLARNAPPLAPSAKQFVAHLKSHTMPPKTFMPRPDTWTASFSARLDDGRDTGSQGRKKASVAVAAACNPATDGVYLYVWEPASRALHKVGTGFHGTLSGNVYRSRKAVLDEVRAYKGMEVVREENDEDDEDGDDDDDDDDEDDGPREERIVGAELPLQSGGVVLSEAAAARRRSLMGTGLNIGGGAELSEDSEGDTGSFITDGSADPIMWAPLNDYRDPGGDSSNFRRPDAPHQLRQPGTALMAAERLEQSSAALGNRSPEQSQDATVVGDQDGNDIMDADGIANSSRENTPSPGRRSPSGARLHRVPVLTTPRSASFGVALAAAERLPETSGGESNGDRGRQDSHGTLSLSRGSSPLRTLDSILGGMDSRLTERRDAARLMNTGEVGGERDRPEDVAAGRPGLLRFRAIEDWQLLSQVPESGHPDDFALQDDFSANMGSIDVGDEGEIWCHKVVHGYRWYRVRILRRSNLDEPWPTNPVGWLPMFTYELEDSEMGSMDSEERAELGGEDEVITILDPVTGDAIAPESTRARVPPTWNGDNETGGHADGRRSSVHLERNESPSAVSTGREGKTAIRPVWLALAGGKLFLREKASGALSAHEVAVFRLSDLSLESVISLTDLPIPGFHTWSEGSAKVGYEDATADEAGQFNAGGIIDSSNSRLVDGQGEDELLEFADAAVGAVVTRCSSNSDTSGGILQHNLLVQDPSQRQCFPPRNSSGPSSASDVAFSFAPTDSDRIIEVDLGRPRNIREVGIELALGSEAAFADAVGSMVVEVSVSGHSWTAVGRWGAPEQREGVGAGEEAEREGGETTCSVRVTSGDESDKLARFVRYSLALPRGTRPTDVPPPCLLRCLTVRGVSRGAPSGFTCGDRDAKTLPFPVMITDSRHIILVHAEGEQETRRGSQSGEDELGHGDQGGRLKLFFLDPEDGYRLVKTASVKLYVPETLLHRQGLLCDGDRLVILGPQKEGTVERSPETAIVSLRCTCAPLEESVAQAEDHGSKQMPQQQEDMDFDVRSTGSLAPHGLGYDRRNNMIWGWDPVLKKLCRWRNDGLPPIFTPPRPTQPSSEQLGPDFAALAGTVPQSVQATARQSGTNVGGRGENEQARRTVPTANNSRYTWIRTLLACSSPVHRVEGLEEAGRCCGSVDDPSSSEGLTASPKREAALLLGYLERLGEPYGPPEEPAAEARAQCELEAASGGREDGNFSRLLVRGEDWSCKEAGMNVLVLSEDLDSAGEISKGFALQESPHAANRLADYLNDVPTGRTVMIAVQDDAAGYLTNSAKRALLSLGAGRDEVAALGMHKQASFALIGRKGAAPGSVPQVLRMTRKGCATIRQRLPPPKVPMCVDVSQGAIDSLVTLILQHEFVLLRPDSLTLDPLSTAPSSKGSNGHDGHGALEVQEIAEAVVLSALNILTNQLFQLLRGATPAQAVEVFSSDHRARLLTLLLAVIDRDQSVPFKQKKMKLHHQQQTQQPNIMAEQSPQNGLSPPPPPNCTTRGTGVLDLKPPRPPPPSDKATNLKEAIAAVGSKVRVVSCEGTLVVNGAMSDGHGDSGGQARGFEGRAKEEGNNLLQNACLRLFVTGMDLFYPTCGERCSLLSRYLTKYLSDGLSSTRQTVLQLLLRRMSDPGQLVELMASGSSPSTSLNGLPAAHDAAVNPFVIPSETWPSSRNRASFDSGTDPTPVASSGLSGARLGVLKPPANTMDSPEGGNIALTSLPSTLAGPDLPPPSPMELQSLLLNVATAETIMKIDAWGNQASSGVGGGGRGGELEGIGGEVKRGGNLSGGVGEAAVEMLGRLTNQLVSSAACIIMESDLEAFDSELDSQDVDVVLARAGLPPFPPSPTRFADTPAMEAIVDAVTCPHVDGVVANTAAPEIGGGQGRLPKDMSAVTKLVFLVTIVCRSCAALAIKAVEVADRVVANDITQGGIGVVTPEVDQLLQDSPLGALLPTLAASITLLVDKHGSKIQSRLSGLAGELIGVMKAESGVLERVPSERQLEATGGSRSVGTVTKTVMMESKHRYEPNTNELHELSIPGASRMTITFDPRTSTEDNYDYVKFWKDEQRRVTCHPRIDKFSGSGNGCNFPGFGGRPPLVIDANRVFVEWRTDQSNEDWGWKFTATAEVGKPSSGGDGGGYWLLGLDRQLAGAGAALAGCLVTAKPWSGKIEDDNAPWMEDDLLAGARDVSHATAVAPSPRTAPGSAVLSGASAMSAPVAPVLAAIFPEARMSSELSRATSEGARQLLPAAASDGGIGNPATQPRCRELECLLGVVDRLKDTHGSALCKAMRAKVGEDQGSVEAVNRAVYATCAALIWHQGLGSDALALAEGRVETPSKALTKTWRFGQQMRQYFNYGDVRDAVESQIEKQRQQAIASDAIIRTNSGSTTIVDEPAPATRPVLTRGPSVYQGAEEKVITEASERIVSRALFLLALPSQACRASTQDQSKRRWGLLSRAGSMGRTSSQNYMTDGADLLERWKEVVDEATAMHKLKSILTYRRKAAEMRERAKKDSVGERIMKFVQCPAEVHELERVRRCRDQRAQRRAEGLRLTRALVAAAATQPAKAWLLNSHAVSVRMTKRDERPGAHVHYLSCVEGCEPNAHLALTRQFARLVTTSLEILKECSQPRTGETPSQGAERRELAVAALRALALDYDVGDHDILKGSILLEVLEPLLEGFEETTGGRGVAGLDAQHSDSDGDSESWRTPPSSPPAPRRENDDADVDDEGKEEDLDALENELMEQFAEELEEELHDRDDSADPRGDEVLVRKAAWCLFEVLLPRCVGLEGQGLETRLEEPTGFSHRLLDVLVRQMGRASANVQKRNESLGINDSLFTFVTDESKPREDLNTIVRGGFASTPPATSGYPLLRNGMRLGREDLGRVAAHREMGIRHSITFWLRRDSCPLDAKAGLWFSPAKAGDRVARGPKWPLGNMTDGGPGGVGRVVSVMKSEMTATVKWFLTGEEGKYKMGAVADAPINDNDSAPASVDDLLVWEVVKVHPSVGGNVIWKGASNNLPEEERNTPWSQFGVSLVGNGTLMYSATSGQDQLFTLTTKHALQPNTWTHVAVVQAKSRARIYIDGEEDTEARVPAHMLNHGMGMPKNIVESQHPYANNTDETWEVAVPGAVSYSITFDPMTKTEPNHDYVTFRKSVDLDEGYFGQEKYSGGRDGSHSNWPGLGGRPPLIINAPSFVVVFRSDQSNFDWGFKFTSLACVPAPNGPDDDNEEDSLPNLNDYPVYLGQPPSYVSSQKSANGYLWGASTYTGALNAEQVRILSRTSPPPYEPAVVLEEACTDVLSLVQRCASSTDGAVSQGGGLSLEASPLVSPQVLGPLLVLLVQGSLKLKLSAARLCENLLPQAPPEMVQVQLSRVGLAHKIPRDLPAGAGAAVNGELPFVRALMLTLGKSLCVWARPTLSSALNGCAGQRTLGVPPRGTFPEESRVTGEEAIALAGAHIRLLRALLAKDGWSGPLSDCLRETCEGLPRVVKVLEGCAEFERKKSDNRRTALALCDPSLWMAHACFALLGGSFQGLHLGGEALALLGNGDAVSVERCTVVAFEYPLAYFLEATDSEAKNSGTSQNATDFVVPAKEWEGMQAFGDAVIVSLHSEPDRPRPLPRGRVSPLDAPLPTAFLSALSAPPVALPSPSPLRRGEMSSASVSSLGASDVMLSAEAQATVAAATEAGITGLVPYIPKGLVDPLVGAFEALSSADATDKRPRHMPLVTVKDMERVLESSHPHERGTDEIFVLDFPGSDSIQLEFDESCRTEEGVAFIRIYKDERQTAIWGEHKYHGRDKSANWPGQYGRPAVCVPAPSCVIRFHAEDRTPDWGYRITARAKCKESTEPPERPPLCATSALTMLQACGAKALLSLVKSWPQFIPSAMPLVKPLAKRALCDDGAQQEKGKRRSPVPQKVVLETEHPYAHNADRKETVKVDGAKKLFIAFDERTRTEPGCDFMSIYTDESMSTGCGETKYTGGKDGHPGNWPGMDGRPPLEIHASSFFFRWVTDGSVNDWGWKMIVTPVLGKVDPANLPLPMLDSKLASLVKICLDCPKDQPSAVGLEKFKVEPRLPNRTVSNITDIDLPAVWGEAQVSPPRTPPRLQKVMGVGIRRGEPERSPYGSAVINNSWPRIFVVNARDAEEVSLRKEPRSNSAEVGKLSVNKPILATGEDGDWLRVLPETHDATSTMIDAARTQPAARTTVVSTGIAAPATAGPTAGRGRLRDLLIPLHSIPSEVAPAVTAARAVARGMTARGGNHDGQDGKTRDDVVGAVGKVFGAAPGPAGSTEGPQTDTQAAEHKHGGPGNGEDDSAESLWVLRRQGDMLYMVPEEESLSHLITLPDEGVLLDGDAQGNGASSADDSSGASMPSFQVMDPPAGVEAGPASQGAFGIVAGEELTTDSTRLWSALTETCQVAASRFSRLALTKILAGWEEHEASSLTKAGFGSISTAPVFCLDALGGPDMFLNLLRTIFADERDNKNETDTAALEVLSKKILNVAKGKTEDDRRVADVLVAFALRQLQDAVSLANFLPPTKAVVRTWETSHNYADNTDSYSKICIPGAKRIRIVFDERCSTEMGCDYARIYKNGQHNTFWGEEKYTGPRSNRNRVWAGVGMRPPLTVEADHFEIYFHSDSSNNDWGVRLSAYGIMQEPSAEQRASLKAKCEALGQPETELACWLLEALAKFPNGDYGKSIMYREATLVTLVRFLEATNKEGKIRVTQLLTVMLHNVGKTRTAHEKTTSPQTPPSAKTSYLDSSLVRNPAAVLEAGGLAKTLRRLADKQAALEESRGTAGRSPLLQSLVQACVVAEGCLQPGTVEGDGGDIGSPFSLSDGHVAAGPDGADNQRWPSWSLGNPPYCLSTDLRDTVITKSKEQPVGELGAHTVLAVNRRHVAKAGGQLLRWKLRVAYCSGEGPAVGVGIGASTSAEHLPTQGLDGVSWLLTWSCSRIVTVTTAGGASVSALFGPKIKSGDAVMVEVDPLVKTVVFYRNRAFVGIAFGPVGSGAALEHGDISSSDFTAFRRAMATSAFPSPPVFAGGLGGNDGCWIADATLRAAVTLHNVRDAVTLEASHSASLTQSPLLAYQELDGVDRTASGVGGASWFELMKESLELMSAVIKRKLPGTFVAKDLLPKYQKHYSKILESTHPLPLKPSEHSAVIPGASAIEVIFDKRTSMGPSDKISIFGSSIKDPERVLVGLEGGTESLSSASNSYDQGIAIGDRVVRGPSWDWGATQDGGPGGFGTVVDIKTWKGKPRAGIKVLWEDTAFEGLYRWDHEGCFDLVVVGRGGTSTKPIFIPGEVVKIKVDPDMDSTARVGDDGWKGALQLRDRSYVAIRLPVGEGTAAMAGAFTIESWFRLRTLSVAEAESGVESGPFPLLSRGLLAGLSQLVVTAVPSSDLSEAKVVVQMHTSDQSSGLRIEGGALSPGKWGHVAVSIDGSGHASLVVDGKKVAQGDFQGSRMEVEDCELALGVSFETDHGLCAHVYDFRLWGHALTPADIASGRKALPTRGAFGLLANFPFDDGLGEAPRNRGTCEAITAQLQGRCLLDVEVESPSPPFPSRWGWSCTVAPFFPLERLQELPAMKEELERFRQVYRGGDTRHELALVRYVNSFAERKNFDATRLLKCSWDDMIPSEEDLVREPLLRELYLWPPPASIPTKSPPRRPLSCTANTGRTTSSFDVSRFELLDEPDGEGKSGNSEDAGTEETKGEPSSGQRTGEGITSTAKKRNGNGNENGNVWAGKKRRCIAARLEVLYTLNKKLRDALPYVDLSQMDRPWSVAAVLSSCRGLIFRVVKDPVLESALSDTAHSDGGRFDLKLSRSKAARNIQAGRTDTEGRWSVFGQAFRQIHPMHPRVLRTPKKLYNCLFMGERAQDAGGPYRESWTMYAQELQSTALPLLIRVPNGKHAAGMGRDTYVPNPGATSPAQVDMFVFLGKLMGHAIRSAEYLGLKLSGVVWKALVGQEVSREDLEGVDVLLTKSMQDIRTIHQKGVTREIFSDIVMETFTTLSLDDREVELKPDGRNTPVTWDNRLEYADLVERHRLAECCSMVKHIRKGLSMVVPLAVLGLFTGDEVECMVCGKPEIDVDLLEAVTEYSGCRKDQPHIKLFWQALRDFTPEERSMLVKFTWGRTRLPLTAEGFSQRFKLQSFSRSPPDNYLPVAHTCFFSLELPAYSSLEVMKERLRNAIYNCQAIDGDDTFAGMQAAAMGWDWEEED